MSYQIINSESALALKSFPDNHFDSVVCDPPYLIGFLGKDWDHKDAPLLPVWQECLRVLKPGGHLLAFSAARTYHKLATSIEEAGFEIRDMISWIYSSGFPKSQDVGKMLERNKSDQAATWLGWGTQLKPAQEPIVMARKPLKQSHAKNAIEYGTGSLNIDATRVPFEDNTGFKHQKKDIPSSGANRVNRLTFGSEPIKNESGETYTPNTIGRFPSNVIGEIQDYQKYFYCPKVSRAERHSGFDLKEIPDNGNHEVGGMYGENQSITRDKVSDKGNNHPTVKPIKLMEYLIKLVTPPNGYVLDPFNGSGSTGMAAVKNGFEYTGIELDPNYCKISRKRIDSVIKEPTVFDELFTTEEK